jgi:FMN phosphatase YigB (HAD superfamily)
VLEDLGFPKFIEPIALSEEVNVEKPNPAIFQLAIEHYNNLYPKESLKSENCLHVGDELERCVQSF